ncbi:hypothetical protein [Candidatus Puniceispirillum sp.]|uniref:hypothetical protein n=1 Tax=Candidatus Puniceispirillum sp. TaxID=2026719 RepID=UPI003F69A413
MDALTFISDQTMYLLSVVLPDANPKQIRLLLLSSVGLAIVLMMFAIMRSLFSEKPTPQEDAARTDETPPKAKKTAKTKQADKAAPKKAGAKKTGARKAVAKKAGANKAGANKAGANKAVAKKKADPKIVLPDETPTNAAPESLTTSAPKPVTNAAFDVPSDDDITADISAPEASTGGFSFFKRESSGAKADAELISIEQEMLAVRQLYMDERITKDVYVVETRRLYEKANALRSG